MTSLNCPIASSDDVALSRKCSNGVDEEKREGELLISVGSRVTQYLESKA